MPTTRLGMVQPINADNADVAVAINPQMQKIDDVIEALVCTSSATYPLTPFLGQIIWDKALRTLFEWSGSVWIELFSPKWGFGKVGYVAWTGTSVVNNNEIGPYASITMTQINGRKYRVHYTFNSSIPGQFAAGGMQARVRSASGTAVTTSGSLIYGKYIDYFDPNSGGQQNSYQGWTEFQASDNTQITLGLFLSKDNSYSGNLTPASSSANNFWIEDIGG
jgi:hypothetical protein